MTTFLYFFTFRRRGTFFLRKLTFVGVSNSREQHQTGFAISIASIGKVPTAVVCTVIIRWRLIHFGCWLGSRDRKLMKIVYNSFGINELVVVHRTPQKPTEPAGSLPNFRKDRRDFKNLLDIIGESAICGKFAEILTKSFKLASFLRLDHQRISLKPVTRIYLDISKYP